MKTIGITGGIGSGKTTVCKIFELLGAPIFYADEEAKKLYDDKKISTQVVKLVGKKVLGKDGEIDKKKLAGIVFSDKRLLTKLNGIIHPVVMKKFSVWKKLQKGKKYVIKEAAIMIESGSYKDIDILVNIKSPKELKIKRLLIRNNTSKEDIETRMKEQLSDKEREKYSDAVIINDDKHSLIAQVLNLHKKISGE